MIITKEIYKLRNLFFLLSIQ